MAISKESISVQDDNGLSLVAINAKDTNQRRRFNVSRSLTCSVQLTVNPIATSGSGTRSTWTVRVSNDNVNFANFPVTQTLTLPTSGAVVSILLDITGYLYVEVACTTASTYTTEGVDMVLCRQS